MKAEECQDLTYIEWVDSTGHDGWMPLAELQNDQVAKCRAVGVFLFEDEESITIALSVDDQHNNVLNALTIPRASILTYTKIESE